MGMNVAAIISLIIAAANPHEYGKQAKRKQIRSDLAFLDPRNQPSTFIGHNNRGVFNANSRAAYLGRIAASIKRRKIMH